MVTETGTKRVRLSLEVGFLFSSLSSSFISLSIFVHFPAQSPLLGLHCRLYRPFSVPFLFRAWGNLTAKILLPPIPSSPHFIPRKKASTHQCHSLHVILNQLFVGFMTQLWVCLYKFVTIPDLWDCVWIVRLCVPSESRLHDTSAPISDQCPRIDGGLREDMSSNYNSTTMHHHVPPCTRTSVDNEDMSSNYTSSAPPCTIDLWHKYIPPLLCQYPPNVWFIGALTCDDSFLIWRHMRVGYFRMLSKW